VFFYNKSKILAILFIVKYEKITLFDEFLVVLGPRFFAYSNEEKEINKNNEGCNKLQCYTALGWKGLPGTNTN
jgi:hypothetical protein